MTRRPSRCRRLRTRARRLKRTKGLALIIVDYIQLMRPAAGTRPENRVLEIGQLTQGLKAIAKELAVPVLALSQLSRAVESREDKRPQLSDLRESGTIEQDADVVMFIYRDEYYLEQRMPKIAAFENQDKYQTAHDEWQRQMEQGAQPGGPDHRQAAPRPDRDDPAVLRSRVHPLRRSGPHAFGTCRRLTTPARSWKSISPPIVANWQLLRTLHPSGPVAGVVKADAYGLGARPVAQALHAAGCRHFFVALFDEAWRSADSCPMRCWRCSAG